MSAPLTIRFATDHSAAKAGMQDLAASVLSNMIKVSEHLHTGIQANGGYAASVKLLAQNVGTDFLSVANAGVAAAANSNVSAVAISTAMGKAAAETKTAAAAMTGARAVAVSQAAFTFGVIRNEALATARVLASSPLVIGGLVGLAAGVIAWGQIKAAVSQANEQIEAYIKLGNAAEAAGVSVEFWQRFLEGAKSAKVAVEDVEAALKSAGQAVRPRFEEGNAIEKRLSEIFESGYTGSYQSQGLAAFRKSNGDEERIRAVITAMQELRTLGLDLAALDVGEKMFGAGFAEKLRSGQASIEAIAESLDRKRDDLIKREEVDRAAEFRERLDEAYRAIDEALHVSVALAGAGRAILDVWLGIVEATATAAKAAGTYLDKMLAAAKAAKDAQPPSALQSPLAPRPAREGEGNLGADLGAVAGRGARGREIYDKPIGPQQPAGMIADPPAPPRRPLGFFLEDKDAAPKPRGGRGGGAGDSIDAVESLINGLEKSAAALKAETEAFGKSNAEKAVAINLAKLKETADQQGITVTDAQIQKMRAASEAAARYKDQLQDLEQAERQLAELQRYAWGAIADNIADAVLEGKSFQNILRDLGKMGFRAGLSALLTGQGPLAGFLGTAAPASAGSNAVGGLAGLVSSFIGDFNPIPSFRANGGPVQAGRPYTVGEIGQELFVPDVDGRIVPFGRGGAGAGGDSYDQRRSYTIDARGAQAGVAEQIAAALSAYDQRLDRSLAGRVRKSNARYGG